MSNPYCGKPGCNEDHRVTYTGRHGNEVKVCRKHYWELVTGTRTPRFDSGIGTELSPTQSFTTDNIRDTAITSGVPLGREPRRTGDGDE